VEYLKREIPSAKQGEVLLKVLMTGICGTDLTIFQGKFDPARSLPPLIPGHEICGTVEGVGGGVEGWKPGDRVAVDPLISCGKCHACVNGYPHVCTTLKLLGVDRDGGFAEYVTVSADRLHRLPGSISDVEGAMVEPVAVAVHDVRRGELAIGESVMVVGGGPIGQLIAMVARAAGAGNVAVAEVNTHRLGIAGSAGFATYQPKDADFRARVKADHGGVGPDVVFDATGSAAGLQSAIDCVRVRGRIVQVGIPKGIVELDLRRINFAELSLVGTRVYGRSDFAAAIGLLEARRIEAASLASLHPLEDCGRLLAELAGGSTELMKPVLKVAG
jgi:2-desacetyl-2-hydroxyethyl bacteriochlorophyllide A dehydrogenase